MDMKENMVDLLREAGMQIDFEKFPEGNYPDEDAFKMAIDDFVLGSCAEYLLAHGVLLETKREAEKDRFSSEKDAEGMHNLILRAPCKIGDDAFVLFSDEESGFTDIDTFEVAEISNKRIWLGGDEDLYYGHDEIGEDVFLSYENAVAYAKEHGMKLLLMDLVAQIKDADDKKVLPARESSGRDFGER